MSVKVKMDNTNSILSRRGLEPGGKAQMFVADEVIRRGDKYVPLRDGPLKNTAYVNSGGREVIYPQPYAKYQYYSTSTSRTYDPMRGAYWFERMKNAEGKEIIEAAARMAGGRTK